MKQKVLVIGTFYLHRVDYHKNKYSHFYIFSTIYNKLKKYITNKNVQIKNISSPIIASLEFLTNTLVYS